MFYNINYMLNSKHLSLVNKIGDKTEFTITNQIPLSTVKINFAIWEEGFARNCKKNAKSPN